MNIITPIITPIILALSCLSAQATEATNTPTIPAQSDEYELYDLGKDSYEWKNLAQSPEYQKKKHELIAAMKAFQHETLIISHLSTTGGKHAGR